MARENLKSGGLVPEKNQRDENCHQQDYQALAVGGSGAESIAVPVLPQAHYHTARYWKAIVIYRQGFGPRQLGSGFCRVEITHLVR